MKKLFKEKMNEGFSLVELVMVMVILGILSAVAVPKMSAVLNRATVRAEKAVVDQIWAGAEQYAGDKLLEEGTETWPYHPLSTFGRTRNMNINLVLGTLVMAALSLAAFAFPSASFGTTSGLSFMCFAFTF